MASRDADDLPRRCRSCSNVMPSRAVRSVIMRLHRYFPAYRVMLPDAGVALWTAHSKSDPSFDLLHGIFSLCMATRILRVKTFCGTCLQ